MGQAPEHASQELEDRIGARRLDASGSGPRGRWAGGRFPAPRLLRSTAGCGARFPGPLPGTRLAGRTPGRGRAACRHGPKS